MFRKFNHFPSLFSSRPLPGPPGTKASSIFFRKVNSTPTHKQHRDRTLSYLAPLWEIRYICCWVGTGPPPVNRSEFEKLNRRGKRGRKPLRKHISRARATPILCDSRDKKKVKNEEELKINCRRSLSDTETFKQDYCTVNDNLAIAPSYPNLFPSPVNVKS